MDLYSRKQRWKLVLAAVAFALVGASLWYSNRIVQDVRAISSHLRDHSRAPVAGLVISCAGRKHVLAGRDDDHEVGAVREGCGQAFPLAGFPSFGEIGPRRTEGGYTRTLFHNMTYILLVFEA